MDSGRLTARWQAIWSAVSCTSSSWALYCGMVTGILSFSTWLTWTLTFGDDRALSCAAILAFAAGISIGGRFPLSRSLTRSELAVAGCTWTLLQSWVLAAMAMLMSWIPVSLLVSEPNRMLFGLVLAIPTWVVSGWLWASLVYEDLGKHSSLVAIGVAVGLGGSSCLLAPWIGTWCTVVVVTALVVACKLIPESHFKSTESSGVTTDDQSVNAPGFQSSLAVVQMLAAVSLGGLLSTFVRLTNELVPTGAQVVGAEWMGLSLGIAIAGWRVVALNVKNRSDWQMLVPAAWGTLLLAALPIIVAGSLWATASLTSVFLLMSFRMLLLIAVMLPIGFAVAGLVSNSRKHSLRHFIPLAVASGFVAVQFGIQSIGLIGLLSAAGISLVLLGLVSLTLTGQWQRSWLATSGVICAALLGCAGPLFSSHHDPARIARLLFSTPTFVAHRAGWDARLLPMLDDARAIDVREGLRGPLTLWRSHGLELHLRENGIPRAVVSADSEAYPQFAPEILQAVYPMLMASNSGHVLVLGASGGVPVTTCLQFPVERVVCVENNLRLVDVIRGPIARESGLDPFADERTQLLALPPEVALMTCREKFDVILSSPLTSAIVGGSSQFTVENYQRAAACLAAGGVFCQRLECIDYGPDPLRMVVQSMRQAFREVIAIETAAGEILLLGTNTEGIFVPGDLPARLEAPHVRNILARSGLDWSALLNFPAYDDAALAEICAETRSWSNSAANGMLAVRGPLELLRWAPKLQEMQQALTAARTSPIPFLNDEARTELAKADVKISRKSRLLEWLGDQRVSPELLRRLSEVATQHKLVRENPETHWWEYRKALRDQLQNHPRSKVQQVGHTTAEVPLHPEDEHRKGYFVALGTAAQQPSPTAEQVQAIASLLHPYDPLLSYFARQEIADLQARGKHDPAAELSLRLHVIYFAPVADASTRNVASALELLVRHPEAIPDPARRFDVLNGLVQTLRVRWESRQTYSVRSPRRQLTDVDRSVVAVEKAIDAMGPIRADAQVSTDDWESRRQVIDRILLRPLRAYRNQLQASANRSELETQSAIDSAMSPEEQR